MRTDENALYKDWLVFSSNLYRYLTFIRQDNRRRLTEALAKRGYKNLSLSFGDILTIIPQQKMRVNELADALHISKQQCAQSLRLIEARGLVKRVQDPSDSRAKFVLLTKKGNRIVRDGIREVAAVNAYYQALIGSRKAKKLSFYLKEAYKIFDVHYGAMWLNETLVVTPPLIMPYVDYLSRDLERKLTQYVASHGHTGLKPSFSQVLAYTELSGTKMVHLSTVNQVTNSAIGRIASELESLGYVKRTIDKIDTRARLVEFTRAGHTLISDTVKSIEILNTELDKQLTKGSVFEFESLCRELCVKLNIDVDIVSKSDMKKSHAIYEEASDSHKGLTSRINMSQLLLYLASVIEKAGVTEQSSLTRFVVSNDLSHKFKDTHNRFSDNSIRKLERSSMQEQVVEKNIKGVIGDKQFDQLIELIYDLSKYVDRK